MARPNNFIFEQNAYRHEQPDPGYDLRDNFLDDRSAEEDDVSSQSSADCDQDDGGRAASPSCDFRSPAEPANEDSQELAPRPPQPSANRFPDSDDSDEDGDDDEVVLARKRHQSASDAEQIDSPVKSRRRSSRREQLEQRKVDCMSRKLGDWDEQRQEHQAKEAQRDKALAELPAGEPNDDVDHVEELPRRRRSRKRRNDKLRYFGRIGDTRHLRANSPDPADNHIDGLTDAMDGSDVVQELHAAKIRLDEHDRRMAYRLRLFADTPAAEHKRLTLVFTDGRHVPAAISRQSSDGEVRRLRVTGTVEFNLENRIAVDSLVDLDEEARERCAAVRRSLADAAVGSVAESAGCDDALAALDGPPPRRATVAQMQDGLVAEGASVYLRGVVDALPVDAADGAVQVDVVGGDPLRRPRAHRLLTLLTPEHRQLLLPGRVLSVVGEALGDNLLRVVAYWIMGERQSRAFDMATFERTADS